jgi:general secretion pathway protein H
MKTPTSGTDVPLHGAPEAGFTLLELLVVLTLVALVVGAVSIKTGRPSTQLQARTTVTDTVNLIRQVRTEAIVSGRAQVLVIDTARRRLSHTGSGSLVILPNGVELIVRVADGDGLAGVRFFQNGGSTGGILQFVWQDGGDEVRINWLTGRVSLAGSR